MAGAKIGALHVSLGIDSASFEAGLKKAQSGLGKWQAAALGAFAAVAVAGAAASVALGRAMGDAIDRFDEMGKAAQKVGLSVEALSRLEYAARLSDVSLETLSGGLRKLSQNMATVAQGSAGPAASAFAALGISATDATGKLRASDLVLADVAEKFSRMEDGTTKTALAVQLFGKSGAELIPLLNSGKAGLADMAAEADRLGITLSTQATKEAEIFNDNLTRVSAATQGIVNTITTAALPVLTYLSQKFVEAAGNGELLQGFARGFVDVLKIVVTSAAVATTTIYALSEAFATLLNAGRLVQIGQWGVALEVIKTGFVDLKNDVAASIDFISGLWTTVDTGAGEEGGPIKPFVADLNAFSNSAAAAKDAAAQLKQELSEGMAVFTDTRTPFEALQLELDKLGHLLNKGAIDWETYSRAVTMATVETNANALGSIAGLLGGLDDAFGGIKELSIATAVLKGAEAIASAFAEGSKFFGPVGGALFAGIAAVTAALNVARVASVGPTSKSIPGGGSTASTPSVPTPAASGSRGSAYINIQGDRFGRGHLESLATELADLMKDGGGRDLQIVLAGSS